MMKITGLSHLFKWENLHNWWLTKYFFAPLYMLSQCKDVIDNPAALIARMRRRELRSANLAFGAFDVPFARIARVEKSELWRIFAPR